MIQSTSVEIHAVYLSSNMIQFTSVQLHAVYLSSNMIQFTSGDSTLKDQSKFIIQISEPI